MEADGRSVTAIVPVKLLAQAKTRLGLPIVRRQELALAFALDTVAALCGSPLVSGVLVVTSDADVTAHVQDYPVSVAPDDGRGLLGAVHAGAQAAATWHPDAGVAVVPADLPCLRPADVTQVLTLATAAPGAFVPDRSGTGTTLLIYRAGHDAIARYGPDSAAKHAAIGLLALPDAPVRARHDVDTLEDLVAATALGLGKRTAAHVNRHASDLGTRAQQ